MRCHTCSRHRGDDEAGWVRVVSYPEGGADGVVTEHYCPQHARQFDPNDPNVYPVD